MAGHDHFQVGIDTGSDWRFLACDPYPSCGVPFHLHDPMVTSETDDFYAILYGDVSGNWTAGSIAGTSDYWFVPHTTEDLGLPGPYSTSGEGNIWGFSQGYPMGGTSDT